MSDAAPPHDIKIVGVGLQKTGTTTLGAALRMLGYRHQSYSIRSAEMYAHGSLDDLMVWVERYQSFDDVPWALMYRRIDEAFPGSRFILTRRRSESAWFASLRKHMQRMGQKSATPEMNQVIYGRSDPHQDQQGAITVYRDHLEAVRDYFRGRDKDFLEVCWEQGDGWPQLCEFLGVAQPEVPFPHENRAPRWWQRARRRWHQRRARRLITPPDRWPG